MYYSKPLIERAFFYDSRAPNPALLPTNHFNDAIVLLTSFDSLSGLPSTSGNETRVLSKMALREDSRCYPPKGIIQTPKNAGDKTNSQFYFVLN
jgi:hypothetical protein